MPHGPGKYDALATHVREQSDAEGVVVIVLGGNKGNGFSVQTTRPLSPAVLAAILRAAAMDIENSDNN